MSSVGSQNLVGLMASSLLQLRGNSLFRHFDSLGTNDIDKQIHTYIYIYIMSALGIDKSKKATPRRVCASVCVCECVCVCVCVSLVLKKDKQIK